MRPPRLEATRADVWPRLAALLLAYGFFHHSGTVLRPLGTVGDTRWADWVDVLTPYVMTGLAASVLAAAGCSRRQWWLFGLAAIGYTQGHGIHLAANSVGNVDPSGVAHFWDEYIGHYVWYVGLALMFAVLASALVERPLPRRLVLAYGLALFAGWTHFTNSIEGQFAWAGLAIAVAFAVWGWRARATAGRLLLAAYGFSLVLFVVFGVWHRGFPEFSELGWI